MAEQALDKLRDIVEGKIDFKGQRLAELWATALLVIVGGIAFATGYLLQDIKLALQLGLGGTALTFLAIVPPLPVFQKNPVKWLPVSAGNVSAEAITVNDSVIR